MTEKIEGYKAFNEDMTNRYGLKFEEGKIYSIEGPLVFGNTGNGFHFCKRLEDTLRYFPVTSINDSIKIAKVIGFDEVTEFYDDYYGYYDMYVARKIKIEKILLHKEIVDMFLNTSDERVVRFLTNFKLTSIEKELYRLRYSDSCKVMLAMSYYQDGDKEAYSKNYVTEKVLQQKYCIRNK